jgi:hypothetical protein
MSNRSNELAVLSTSEWLQPDTFERILRAVPSILSSLSKLKTMLPKRGGNKRDLKTLGTEIDELRKDLGTVCNLISTSLKSHTKLVEAAAGLVSKAGALPRLVHFISGSVGNLNKVIPIVLGHEARLKTLEASIAVSTGKRGSGKKSPAPTGAKAHRKPKVRRVK